MIKGGNAGGGGGGGGDSCKSEIADLTDFFLKAP